MRYAWFSRAMVLEVLLHGYNGIACDVLCSLSWVVMMEIRVALRLGQSSSRALIARK